MTNQWSTKINVIRRDGKVRIVQTFFYPDGRPAFNEEIRISEQETNGLVGQLLNTGDQYDEA